VTAERPAPLLDVTALTRWLDTTDLPGKGEPIEQRRVSGGSQNEIFEIRRGELHGALRKPPTGAPPDRDSGVLREWRIVKALSGSDVAHPEAIAVCDDPTVLGRSFYLMELIDGWSPMNAETLPFPFDSDPDLRNQLAYQLVEGIAQMGALDWQARGLSDLGNPDGFHERQVPRWTRFHEEIKGRDLAGLAEATGWLDSHRPIDFVPGLMHGDYQFANVMFHYDGPARLAAIVDWEMGTIGDPKLDLAWTLRTWPEDTSSAAGALKYMDITGMPSRSSLVQYYAERSGRQVDDFDYYLVLARWKTAIVLEKGYQRAGDNPVLQMFGAHAAELMQAAAELAATTDYRGPRP
jgi:aminoglycoside phosphotransferase (APT) family kinase protein